MQFRNYILHDNRRRAIIYRMGISLLEVIFAMGVLLVGLLGLAAILPIATNNALQSLNRDRAQQAYLNQAAMRSALGVDDVSKMSTFFEAVTNGDVFDEQADAARRNPNNPNVPPPERYITTPVATTNDLPEAFCVDPWFLTTANTLRYADNRNYYDRGLFPCYDDHYDPGLSPSSARPAIPTNEAWSIGSNSNRRLKRIGISSVTSPAFHGALAKDRDTISVVLNPEDKGQAPGLFIKRTNSGRRSNSMLSGRYSYMMTVRRNGTGNVVVFRDRQVTVNPTADYFNRHNLTPYTALPATESNIPLEQRTYSDERVGYVSYADRIFNGAGGSFEYEISRFVDPTVSVGDWLMLARRDYGVRPALNASPSRGELQFAWCQITSVDEEPKLEGDIYRTKVSVRDVSWQFHPIQAYQEFLGAGPYPGRNIAPPPTGWNGVVYDKSAVNGNRNRNPGHTGTLGDPLYGTIVVLMKNVVSVQNF